MPRTASNAATRPVLVTGAWGLVGSCVIEQLARAGRPVVAVDVATPATARAAETVIRRLGVDARHVTTASIDLLDEPAVADVVDRHRPTAVAHLAAVLPPIAYRVPDLADRVNVDGTANVVRAVRRLADRGDRCRIVLASSVSVYGAWDPARGIVTADTPVAPAERYAHHKVACERLLARSGLPGVVLRIGVVLDDRVPRRTDADNRSMVWSIPADNATHTIDRRDCAAAVVGACTATPVVEGRTLLIGGDDSHRGTFATQLDRMFSVLGVGGLPDGALLPGVTGDPETWYTTAWMDTSEAQRLLRFQHRPVGATLADVAADAGIARRLAVPARPIVQRLLSRQAAAVHAGRTTAAPWLEIERLFGPVVRGAEVDVEAVPVA